MRFRQAPEVMLEHELSDSELRLGLFCCILRKKGLGVPCASRDPEVYNSIILITSECAAILDMLIPIHDRSVPL